MDSREADFLRESNEPRAVLKERSEKAKSLLAEDFDIAKHIIESLKAATPEGENNHHSMEAKIAHIFINVVGSANLSVWAGSIRNLNHNIDGAILRMEALENYYGGELDRLKLEQKPSAILKTMKVKLDEAFSELKI